MQKQSGIPIFMSRGKVTLKTLKYKMFPFFHSPCPDCHGIHWLLNVELCWTVQTLTPAHPPQPAFLTTWDLPPSLQTQDQSTLPPTLPSSIKANLPFLQACHSSPGIATVYFSRGMREVFFGKIIHWIHCVTASPCRTAATMSCQISPWAGVGGGGLQTWPSLQHTKSLPKVEVTTIVEWE